MQDQSRTVRNSFAYKVHRTMYAFEQGQHSNQKAAKYAAMLALAGADPNMQNQQVTCCTISSSLACCVRECLAH